MRPLRRRDFLFATLTAGGALAAVKVVGRLAVGSSAPRHLGDPSRLTRLTPHHEAIVTAIALAMVGPAAETAYDAQRWDPAAAFDDNLGLLPADQVGQITLALTLVEEWTWGLTGFTGHSRDQQRIMLDTWKTSSLAVQRSIWGVMHALSCSSFGAIEAGWEVMQYPGPCVASSGSGRSPGQTVSFTWDEVVP
jgi:hypothetical protein